MKKILWLVVACMLVSISASAEDGPTAPAFFNKEIRDCEYQTSGLMKKKLSETGDYLGKGAHQGFLAEINFYEGTREIFGVSQVQPDLFVAFEGNMLTPYTCLYDLPDYLWDPETNNLTHDPDDPDDPEDPYSYVYMLCWDPIQDPGMEFPLLDQDDCTASIKFTDPDNFTGKIKCDDGFIKLTLTLSGKKLGKYVIPEVPTAFNKSEGIKSLREKLRK